MDINDIAQICHEANRALCLTVGDASQVPWNDAPAWQRESAINGVHFILDNPDAPDSATHDSWAKEKTDAGWVYGLVKDAEKKEHPCLVPFDKLPPFQQAKDTLFKAVAKSLLTYLD